jgi:hypothetical protein
MTITLNAILSEILIVSYETLDTLRSEIEPPEIGIEGKSRGFLFTKYTADVLHSQTKFA